MHTPKQMKAMSYCLEQGYKITPVPIDNFGNYMIEVSRADNLVERIVNEYNYGHYFKDKPSAKKELNVFQVIPMEYEKLYEKLKELEKMNLTMIYDTETTGLPGKKASYKDNDFPRLVQIAWIIINELDGKVVEEVEYIVKPDGWTIPKEASDIHRITNARAKKEGVPILTVLNSFNISLNKVKTIVAHNEHFDRKILQSEFYKAKKPTTYSRKKIIDTMKSTYKWVNAPHSKETIEKYPFLKGRIKWCNMDELHTKLFGEGFEDAHDALVDVKALAKCYLELKRIKRI